MFHNGSMLPFSVLGVSDLYELRTNRSTPQNRIVRVVAHRRKIERRNTPLRCKWTRRLTHPFLQESKSPQSDYGHQPTKDFGRW